MEEKSTEKIIDFRILSNVQGLKIILLLASLTMAEFLPGSAWAWECDVTVGGPDIIKIDQTITLSAEGTPEGGSYSWSNTPNLEPAGATAQLTGFVPTFSDYIKVISTYTTPKGKSCSDTKWVWVCLCYAKISGPTEAKAGSPIVLTASGDPDGGDFEWDSIPGLTANGQTAEFVGQELGEVTIKVTYTPSGGEPCTDFHKITVTEGCTVSIAGATSISVGGNVDLVGSGTPLGGTFQWSTLPGLITTSGSTATFFVGTTTGDSTIGLTYTTATGTSCYASHKVTAYKVASLSGPVCVNSGTVLANSDFRYATDPIGFESLVSIDPLSFSTLLQYEEETVTASCGPWPEDDATALISIVNSEVQTGISVKFEIPNYVNDALRIIGIGDKTDLKLDSAFTTFTTCCFGTTINESTDGNAKLGLFVDGGPFTIVGFPLPPSLKNWVTLDALSVTVSGNGSGAIDGKHDGCTDAIAWSGAGSLAVGVEVKGEVKIKASGNAIVIEGSVGGSSEISEGIAVSAPNLLLSGDWNGLIVAGKIHIELLSGLKIKKEIKHILLDNLEIPLVTIPLPSL
ncbi:MAG: hypothetical protein AB1461_04085 [Thermodesulfobacteriota bacterium]